MLCSLERLQPLTKHPPAMGQARKGLVRPGGAQECDGGSAVRAVVAKAKPPKPRDGRGHRKGCKSHKPTGRKAPVPISSLSLTAGAFLLMRNSMKCVICPTKPTEEMLQAGAEAIGHMIRSIGLGNFDAISVDEILESAYLAMIEPLMAAGKTPQSSEHVQQLP